jgi:hypothetical protein
VATPPVTTAARKEAATKLAAVPAALDMHAMHSDDHTAAVLTKDQPHRRVSDPRANRPLARQPSSAGRQAYDRGSSLAVFSQTYLSDCHDVDHEEDMS